MSGRALPPHEINEADALNQISHSLHQRSFYPNQLWGEAGPIPKDVGQCECILSLELFSSADGQGKVLDCWWKAAEAAIAHVSPAWVQHLFIDPQTYRPYAESGQLQPQADAPLVQLWDPNDLSRTAFHQANIHARSQTEDKGMKGYFWPDALSQALSELGKSTDIPGVDRSTGSVGSRDYWFDQPLSILTGYPSDSRLVSNYSSDDELFNHFSQCNDTPIMIFTNESVPIDNEKWQFGSNHVYPISRLVTNSTGRFVWVRNVWGRNEDYRFEDLKKNAFRVLFLRDWNRLEPDRDARRRDLSSEFRGKGHSEHTVKIINRDVFDGDSHSQPSDDRERLIDRPNLSDHQDPGARRRDYDDWVKGRRADYIVN